MAQHKGDKIIAALGQLLKKLPVNWGVLNRNRNMFNNKTKVCYTIKILFCTTLQGQFLTIGDIFLHMTVFSECYL
jgi:hypothetical protein